MLSTEFLLTSLFVFILYGLSANGVRRYITQSPEIITRKQRSLVATFAVLGVKLAAH